MSTLAEPAGLAKTREPADSKMVVFASSLGTVFEWYDFYLYGALAVIISKQFFSGVNPTAGFIFALMAFAAGFIVRPFGAIFFGRIGDLVGRKYTFLVTISIMGISTFVVGLLPSYATIGIAAPIILVALRILQGLALGGEYGGAATYVAEHAPAGKRGLHTSWIQTTATLGLFLSLLVILVTRTSVGEEAFADWGWRIPFLISLLLLLVSVWIRMKLSESPTFQKMKDEGKGSKAPLTESFGQWRNLKIVLLALFGLTAGQAVVWYTGQFYALFFLTQSLKVDATTANLLIAISLAIGTPGFILFGWLSDKIGRKRIILAGCLLAVFTYFPVFKAITHFANPALEAAQASAPVTVVADPQACSFQFDPVGKAKFLSSCDIAKSFLAKNSVTYKNEEAPAGTAAQVRVGDTTIASFEGLGLPAEELKAKTDAFTAEMSAAVTAAGYPAKSDLEFGFSLRTIGTTLLLVYLVVLVTMVYGPIAAMLVEMFPTRIRYTSMSLPYHIGNGWFGGLLPTISFAMVAAQGDIYYGLWYPIIIAAMTFLVGMFFIHETKDHRAEVW
ncbi:MFS transporter [Dongia sp.]|uniref:MFS transporter n=1 Tax=Dongia sp. TaxID=1977262 RepID=UPI0035B2CAAE